MYLGTVLLNDSRNAVPRSGEHPSHATIWGRCVSGPDSQLPQKDRVGAGEDVRFIPDG